MPKKQMLALVSNRKTTATENALLFTYDGEALEASFVFSRDQALQVLARCDGMLPGKRKEVGVTIAQMGLPEQASCPLADFDGELAVTLWSLVRKVSGGVEGRYPQEIEKKHGLYILTAPDAKKAIVIYSDENMNARAAVIHDRFRAREYMLRFRSRLPFGDEFGEEYLAQSGLPEVSGRSPDDFTGGITRMLMAATDALASVEAGSAPN